MEKQEIKVLLAVPDVKLQDILVYLLRAWEYGIAALEEGEDAVERAKIEAPHLIIIDSAFAGRRGLEVCKRLKSDFLTSYIPTIVLIDKRQLRRDLLNIEQGVDDYLIKPPDPIDLEIRMVLALRSTAHHFNANALTNLPGNRLIEQELTKRIGAKAAFSFHYLDIDNFKSYNDKYGHIRGDAVIKETALIVSSNVKRHGQEDDFVGHIGGDDFVVISSPRAAEEIARKTIYDFDQHIPNFYSDEDRESGCIVARDRAGKLTNIPLMSLSIAIVNNTPERLLSLLELTDVTAEIKKYLKGLTGSNFMINRRIIDKGKSGRNRESKR